MPSSVSSAETGTSDISSSEKAPVANKATLPKAIENLGTELLTAGRSTDKDSPVFSSSFLGLPEELLTQIASMLDPASLKSFRLTHRQLQPSARAATQKLTVSNGKDLADILRTYKTGGIERLTLKGTQLSMNDLKLLGSEGVNIKNVHLDFTESRKLSNKRLAEILGNFPVPIQFIDLSGCSQLTEDGLASALATINKKNVIGPIVIKPEHLMPILTASLLNLNANVNLLTQLPSLSAMASLSQLNISGASDLTALPHIQPASSDNDSLTQS